MRNVQKITIGIVIVTLVILVWYHFHGNTKTYTITPDQFRYMNIDDSSKGGLSRSAINIKDGKAYLTCEVVNNSDYPWPYCELEISLSDSIFKGIDFSEYNQINLDIDYTTSHPNKRLRVYVRNSHPAYTRANERTSLKFNGIEYSPGFGDGATAIALETFQVLTWWISDNNISIEHASADFSNVPIIEIATASGVTEGKFEIVVNNIEFQGVWIDESTMLKGLLYTWLLLVMSFILYEQSKLHRRLRQSHLRAARLFALNQNLTEKNIQFSELANRDSLTGALNRHAVQDWLKDMAQQVRWGHQDFSTLFIDIDHFKSVNDKYGHQVGDDILREFVLVISSNIRSNDCLVRWGGEEFIVFFPETNSQQAMNRAETIRNIIATHQWCHNKSVTCSIGVAQMGQERITEMIARADDALYKAKGSGRNKVVFSPPPLQ
ncbi:MAG: GGDEF domain-containing protein [Moritella sp.]|uniref:GGDEF domain-containing protein n=1 Tax=Moritella sp. TaxID=78556 RepID=UPI0029A868AF|nr:GGDEF domain-containing protein [Moritella sp.]MDX2321463.1 GGDEF domain-containing protein [Moritella sp.]